uniref:Repeat domain-containing protein n=1 Tax=Candidatus Kentrum eta TaxID=2126337 RepID=A0A450UAR6_9GAMM|nr:MAG: Repeat domain-containing protein [Candidatus Kentron sp. H]VFJ91236.1 MAG: Repeat domain-containing protein [Candidatus Kentron sp. H]VFJ97688.1 MAG: Repeat domain-containing protein [Candidatus Kentron sp. H]
MRNTSIFLFLLSVLSPPAANASPADPGEAPRAAFSEIAGEAGLDFVHSSGISGEFYFPEILGSGGALFDYDRDGDLDVYLVQSHGLACRPTIDSDDAECPKPAEHRPPPRDPLHDRLYRNDLVVAADGTRRVHFTDVTRTSGIRAAGYGMGVAVGDVDNDGWPDLYVTNHGPNQLFRNNGDGTFVEMAEKAGVAGKHWSVSAAFLDFDRDGWLDLFVGNYVNASLKNHEACYAPDGSRDYCSPKTFRPLPCRLFRNRGDGGFEDVSGRSGIIKEYQGALGVVGADFNGDGWTDIYVANDGRPNLLWMNQGDGTFRNEALLAGTAVNMDGAAEASMGVDAGDFDNDGDEDLFMTHLTEESNTLYVNDGTGWFQDRSVAAGVAASSQGRTAFGTRWFDFNHDGWLDLLIVNGDVRVMPNLARTGDPLPFHQTNQLLANVADNKDGGRGFVEITDRAGAAFAHSGISRGAAFGDVDNDGDVDILVTNNSGPVRLLRNDLETGNHWLGLHLVDPSGRDALGARVRVEREGAPTLWRRSRTDGSYASSNDPRVVVGLGASHKVKAVRVLWPSGRVEEWKASAGADDLAVDRYLTLREGEGS